MRARGGAGSRSIRAEPSTPAAAPNYAYKHLTDLSKRFATGREFKQYRGLVLPTEIFVPHSGQRSALARRS